MILNDITQIVFRTLTYGTCFFIKVCVIKQHKTYLHKCAKFSHTYANVPICYRIHDEIRFKILINYNIFIASVQCQKYIYIFHHVYNIEVGIQVWYDLRFISRKSGIFQYYLLGANIYVFIIFLSACLQSTVTNFIN